IQKQNIGVGIHFRGLHLQPYYKEKYQYKPEDFPVASYVSDRVISIPLYPKMSEDDVLDTIQVVKRVIKRSQ
ncbi:MAG: DegT/DnrJ/EryC1/StrS family aminotransferase, partial [bacterium]